MPASKLSPTPPQRSAEIPHAVGHFLPEPPTGWRAALLRAGHGRAVGLITAFSVLASVLLTGLVTHLAGGVDDPWLTLATAIAVPLLVAPLVSHQAMALLYEIEDARALLHQAAIRDPLTHLPNRRFFMARLDEEAARAHRTREPLSVLMIDVDHFKAINDGHGHAAGDAVLEHLARRLCDALRPYDLVARYGGEEFVALMPGTDFAEAEVAAERVRSAIEAMPVSWPAPGPGSVTASIGHSCLGAGEAEPAALLRRADRAMYLAKHAGRNRCAGLAPEADAPATSVPAERATRHAVAQAEARP